MRQGCQAIVSLYILGSTREVLGPAVKINDVYVEGDPGYMINPTYWKIGSSFDSNRTDYVCVRQGVIEKEDVEELRKYLHEEIDFQIKALGGLLGKKKVKRGHK